MHGGYAAPAAPAASLDAPTVVSGGGSRPDGTTPVRRGTAGGSIREIELDRAGPGVTVRALPELDARPCPGRGASRDRIA